MAGRRVLILGGGEQAAQKLRLMLKTEAAIVAAAAALDPELAALCDAFTPSIVDRDPLVVAIGTEGTAPVLARQVKAMVETLFEPSLGELAALAGRLNTEVPPASRLQDAAHSGPGSSPAARARPTVVVTPVGDTIARLGAGGGRGVDARGHPQDESEPPKKVNR